MQKKLIIATIVLLVCAGTVSADIKPVADEATGRMLEQRRQRALINGDEAFFRTLLYRDVRYIHSTGLVQTKDDVVDMLTNNVINYLSIDVLEENYAIFTKSIVVTGTQKIRLVVKGKHVNSTSRYTIVYQIIREKWRCVAYQSTPVPEEKDAR